VGSLAASLLVFAGPVLGIVLGSQMPWVDAARLGPLSVAPFVWSMVALVLPNLVFTGGTLFTLAALTRSVVATYMGLVGTVVAYGVSQALAKDLPSQLWAALLDPFGMAAVRLQTRYWTIVERNTALPQLSGALLANRLVWTGVGLGVLAFGIWWFDPGRRARSGRRHPARPGAAPALAAGPTLPRQTAASTSFAPADRWRMLLHQVRLETVTILRSAPFVVMLAFAVLNVLVSCLLEERVYGTTVLPETHLMLDALNGAYLFMLVIVLTLYAGETVWRERTLRLAEVHDALPARPGSS